MTFERIVQVQAPYDRRHPDPKKNCGIHGMTLRFILKGKKGATQFVFYTAQHLRHVADELYARGGNQYNPFHGMGADIGYHAYKPLHAGQEVSFEECDILGCPCYYDGTSRGAMEFEEEFLRGGDAVVWPMLEARYKEIFGEEE
jgi:hypothetical protein